MKASGIDTEKFRSAFVIILVLAITAIFTAMIWEFLKALLLAAVFSGLLSPVYRRLVITFRGSKTLASITTILLVLVLVLGPVSAFLGIVVKQAVEVSQSAIPWFKEQMAAEHTFDIEKWIVERVPLFESILPSRETVLSSVATIAEKLGNALVASASRVTAGTAAFFLNLFIMLYAMFFFLIDGRAVLNKILYYTPLAAEDDEAMLHRFASITRATMKGTIVIALVQGALGGIAFWVAGIKGAAFWGTIMALLSIVPGIGTPLVWIPAAIYLLVTGEVLAGVLLTIWCAGVVGSIDNVLRPTLVGKDAQMPDLLILLGTLGGIFMFGPVGFIIGPIICGLFVTVWDIYGETFKDVLPSIHRSALANVGVEEKKPEPLRKEER